VQTGQRTLDRPQVQADRLGQRPGRRPRDAVAVGVPDEGDEDRQLGMAAEPADGAAVEKLLKVFQDGWHCQITRTSTSVPLVTNRTRRRVGRLRRGGDAVTGPA
jgi:hypothetical protein